MKNPWVIIGVIAVLLIGGAVVYSGSANDTYNAGIAVQAHIKGNPDAAVKLVEYSDFQCPACAQFQPFINEIVAEYGDQLSFEYRHFPLSQIHRLAEPAARAAEAAGQQGKFFEFHDKLFENQRNWSNSTNPAQFFITYATELGLDIDVFTKAQRSSILRDHVRSQFDEARAAGFTGTPSFLLNGEKMEFRTFDEFRAQIVAAIDPTIDLSAGLDAVASTSSDAVDAPANAAPAVQFGI